MKFTIRKDAEILDLEVDPTLLTKAVEFFQKMDKDMDLGRRMGPEFVAHPNAEERTLIVCQELVTAMEMDNQSLLQMMVGYIIARNPGCTGVVLGDDGDPRSHRLTQVEA